MGDHAQNRSEPGWLRLLRALSNAITGQHYDMDLSSRLSRARFRAWHRGTREADYIIGSYFDHHHPKWEEHQVAWFEMLLEEDDADVMGWALQAQPVPERLRSPQMTALQRLDYVKV